MRLFHGDAATTVSFSDLLRDCGGGTELHSEGGHTVSLVPETPEDALARTSQNGYVDRTIIWKVEHGFAEYA
jgi:hypothetical protein